MTVSIERYKKILGEDFEVLEQKPAQAIRINTLKITSEELKNRLTKKGWKLEYVPWCEDAFFVNTNELLSKTIEHSLGYYFLQNASSMIPPLVLDPKPNEIILDLCAAPGAKTTQMSAMMKNTGVIIANDVKLERLKSLRGNLQRCGVLNAVVTVMDGMKFWETGMKFEKILLDAPCSATGTLNPRVLEQTNERAIRWLSGVQKKLLASAAKCLSENGVLVYSTCSLEPEENEENIDFAVRELGLSVEKIEIGDVPRGTIVSEWDGKKFDESVRNAIRIIPTNQTEGFFVCKLRF